MCPLFCVEPTVVPHGHRNNSATRETVWPPAGPGPMSLGNGPMIPGNGPLIPRNGPLIPRNGPLIPRNGPLIPGNGPLIPRNGPSIPRPARLIPEDLNLNGRVSPPGTPRPWAWCGRWGRPSPRRRAGDTTTTLNATSALPVLVVVARLRPQLRLRQPDRKARKPGRSEHLERPGHRIRDAATVHDVHVLLHRNHKLGAGVDNA